MRDMVTVDALFLGAGSSAPTVVYAPGIKSITRTGTGAYTIAFNHTALGTVLDARVFVHNAAGTAPFIGQAPAAANTFVYVSTPTTGGATITIETYSLASGTPAIADVPSGAMLSLEFKFAKSIL